jgi:hypothetical protein
VVLLGYDVVDLEGHDVELLGELTILAPVAGTVTDELP